VLTAYCSCLCLAPAADKMHYLHLVIRLQQRIVPLRAAHDVVIEFDGYLLWLETQLRD